jgi:hypothetical protein
MRLDSGTAFNVLAAQVISEKVQDAIAVAGKWAVFNTARKEVVLTDKITTGCLFAKSNVKVKKRVLRVVVEIAGGNYQLRVQGKRISEFNGEYVESSEVSMVEYGRQNDELIGCFIGQEICADGSHIVYGILVRVISYQWGRGCHLS